MRVTLRITLWMEMMQTFFSSSSHSPHPSLILLSKIYKVQSIRFSTSKNLPLFLLGKIHWSRDGESRKRERERNKEKVQVEGRDGNKGIGSDGSSSLFSLSKHLESLSLLNSYTLSFLSFFSSHSLSLDSSL